MFTDHLYSKVGQPVNQLDDSSDEGNFNYLVILQNIN